jgi:simple sugar transport system permease protein
MPDLRYLLRLGAFALGIFILFCGLQPHAFLSVANLSSMASQMPEFALLALAIHGTMLTGGIDLSVVSIANFGAILAAFCLKSGPAGLALAVPAALLLGIACGVFNGLLVAGLRLPAILATLGTMQLYAGLAVGITSGVIHSTAVTGIPLTYSNFVNGFVLGVPTPFLILAASFGVVYLITARSPLGKQMRLFGTNPRAAVFAGIPTFRVLILTYAVSGLIAACAGLVMLARANSASADYGTSYLLLGVLINILAGVNPNGGSGTLFGVALAVLSLQFISSGLNLLAVNSFARDLLYGLLLVTVMAVNRLQGRIHSTRPRA